MIEKKKKTISDSLLSLSLSGWLASLVAGLVGRWTKQSMHVRAPLPNMTHHHQHEGATASAIANNTNVNSVNRSKSRKKVLPNQLGRYKNTFKTIIISLSLFFLYTMYIYLDKFTTNHRKIIVKIFFKKTGCLSSFLFTGPLLVSGKEGHEEKEVNTKCASTTQITASGKKKL